MVAKAEARLKFLGAFGGVTGSRTLLSFEGSDILVDCGLFQGPKEVRQQNWEKLAVDLSRLKAIVLTHAHLDHIGYLPRLYKQGFRGPIYCSAGTAELARIILLDAAHLEEELASYARQTAYSNHADPQPLFTTRDAEAVLDLLKPQKRDFWMEVAGGITLRFLRAGHIIGASVVQLMVQNGYKSKTFSFSGDVGHYRSLILKGPQTIDATDVLILESTYGNRLHGREDPSSVLGGHLKRALERRGVIVVPAFAVGRSQELIYMIARLEQEGKIPSVPVILDSPMSQKALDHFFRNAEDQSIDSSFGAGRAAFFPKKFEGIQSTDQSMLATMMDGPLIVISASGMLSGGRVLHHLKRRLPHPENMVIFCGYQAEGTKGRYLQESAAGETVRIHHEEVPIEAEIVTIDHLSSHADYEELVHWLRPIAKAPEQVLLNHGNPDSQKDFASFIKAKLGWKASAAAERQSWEFDLS